jgi:hypothetical protein
MTREDIIRMAREQRVMALNHMFKEMDDEEQSGG